MDADNSEEVSTKVRELLRENPVLLRRIGEAYPNLEVKSRRFVEKINEAVEETKRNVEEKKRTVEEKRQEVEKAINDAVAEKRRHSGREKDEI